MLKEKMMKLVKAVGKDDVYIIDLALKDMTDYINSVISYVFGSEAAKEYLEGEHLREELKSLDVKRKLKHDSAIASIAMLNRLCDILKIEHVTNVDLSDRYAVADYIGQFVCEVYFGEILPADASVDRCVAGRNGKMLPTMEVNDVID